MKKWAIIVISVVVESATCEAKAKSESPPSESESESPLSESETEKNNVIFWGTFLTLFKNLEILHQLTQSVNSTI